MVATKGGDLIDGKNHQTRSWTRQAACRGINPDLFFPAGSTGPAFEQTEEAKAVCRACEVQPECLSYALETHQEYGVWGGTSEDERRVLRREWLRVTRLTA